MNKKFDTSKYTNIFKVIDKYYFKNDYKINFFGFIGGRRLGKTYSALWQTYLRNLKILYVRLSKEQLDLSTSVATNPYKAINNNEATNILLEKCKGGAYIYDVKSKDNKEYLGMATALSTFGNMRGADFSDIDVIFFDEFMSYSPIKTTTDKKEFNLLFNLVDTVNSNRELEGRPPVLVIIASNSESIDNNIIRTFGLGEEIHKMKVENRNTYIDTERGLYFELIENKDVRDARSETSVYRLTKGTSYYEMALNNEFTNDYFGDVKQVNFKELVPIVNYNNIYFYKHKSKELLYVCKRKANCDSYTDLTKKAFKRDYGYMMEYYITNGLTIYSDYSTKMDVADIFK